MQNTTLRTVIGCTRDTNMQHLHDGTQTLPLTEHFKQHTSQITKEHPCHPLHKLTKHNCTPKLMKQTTFNNTTNIPTNPNTVTMADISANKKTIHSAIVTKHLTKRHNNKIQALPPNICSSEETLPRHTRRTLAQLRTDKSPFLTFYLYIIDAHKHPSPFCPFCKQTYRQHKCSPQTPTHSVVTPGFVDKSCGDGRAACKMEQQHGRRTNHGTISMLQEVVGKQHGAMQNAHYLHQYNSNLAEEHLICTTQSLALGFKH